MGPTEYFIPSQLKPVESASARRKMYHISNPRVIISPPNVFLSKTQPPHAPLFPIHFISPPSTTIPLTLALPTSLAAQPQLSAMPVRVESS